MHPYLVMTLACTACSLTGYILGKTAGHYSDMDVMIAECREDKAAQHAGKLSRIIHRQRLMIRKLTDDIQQIKQTFTATAVAEKPARVAAAKETR